MLGFSGIVTKWLHFSSSPTHALGCIVRGWNIFDSLYIGAGDNWLYVENILLVSVKIPESKEWKKIRGDKSMMDTRCLAMLDGPLIILVLLHSYNIRDSSIMPWHLSQLQLQTYSYIVQHILLRTQPVRQKQRPWQSCGISQIWKIYLCKNIGRLGGKVWENMHLCYYVLG